MHFGVSLTDVTSSLRISGGTSPAWKVLRQFGLARLALMLGLVLAPLSSWAEDVTSMEVKSVKVIGKKVPIKGNQPVDLSSFPDSVVFGFGPPANSQSPLRIRYTLEGYEDTWHEQGSEMDFSVRFYDEAGDQVDQKIYGVSGESTGWTGSLKNSSLRHRRETLVVPPKASRLLIVISSAGPPETIGIYVVANLIVTKSSGKSGNDIVLQSPLENDFGDPPAGWMHDGRTPSMARIVKFGQDPQTRGFAIIDEDRASHGEWHNILETAPQVIPGDSLVVEWNEMFSSGAGFAHDAIYDDLPSGHYKFRLHGLNVMGALTGVQASVAVFVPPPFWRTPWFWGAAVIAITVLMIGISRYFVWHRMRREMVRLKHQRALEQERLRIANDIHDDLGARVTQISLLSGMAQDSVYSPEKARSDFARISEMSRDLVSALYETVWAVNPENDNLEAQGNYLCQMVNQLCERTKIRCRFHVLGLPPNIQVSSQTRHNINMVVKEAVHNVIKHSRASEVTIRMTCTNGTLNILIEDNGTGFDPRATTGGHGLANMKQRLANIGGSCEVESKPGQGTKILIHITIRSLDKTSRAKLASTPENN